MTPMYSGYMSSPPLVIARSTISELPTSGLSSMVKPRERSACP